MLDTLLEHVKNHIAGVLENEKLPNGIQSDEFAHVTSSAIFVHLKTAASKGNVDAVMQMFSGKDTHPAHPSLKQIKLHLIEEIKINYKIEEQQAEELIVKFLPSVMNLFNSHVTGGGLDIESIVSQFKGSSVSNVVENSNKKKNKTTGGIFSIFTHFFKK